MIRSKLYNFFIEPVIAFALPAFCISCEQKLENGRKIICAPCFNQLPVLDDKYISVLLEEIKHPYFDELIIKYQFAETFQKLIHLFKYQRTLTLATYFAEAVATIIKKNNYDIITGIPLNPVKEKERGYNQSALIAKELGRLLNIQYAGSLVQRIRNTPSQTKLNREQRIKNMQEAFSCSGNVIDKKVILVDDIITTGSTLNACAEEIKKQKAAKVTAVALATPVDILQQNLEKDTVDSNRF